MLEKEGSLGSASPAVAAAVIIVRLCPRGASQAARGKSPPIVQEMRVPSLGREDPLEEEMATHSGMLAWKIPQTRVPGRLQSTGVAKSRTQLSEHAHVSRSSPRWGGGCSPNPHLQPYSKQYRSTARTSLVNQWLRLHAPGARGLGSIPGQGTGSHMYS